MTALHAGRAELSVLAVFGPNFSDGFLPGRPAVSEIVGGSWDGTLPCDESSAGIATGEEVFALYARGEQDGHHCAEYHACSDERCGPGPDEAGYDGETWDPCDAACLIESRSVCATHADEARLGGLLDLAPWRAQLQLTESASIAAEDVAVMVEGSVSCLENLDVVELENADAP